MVAPKPVTNAEFTADPGQRALASCDLSHACICGEDGFRRDGREVLLGSQRVEPAS